jgi:hypothetical protein
MQGVKEGLNVPDDLFKSELREWDFGTKDFLGRIAMEQAASGSCFANLLLRMKSHK